MKFAVTCYPSHSLCKKRIRKEKQKNVIMNITNFQQSKINKFQIFLEYYTNVNYFKTNLQNINQ